MTREIGLMSLRDARLTDREPQIRATTMVKTVRDSEAAARRQALRAQTAERRAADLEHLLNLLLNGSLTRFHASLGPDRTVHKFFFGTARSDHHLIAHIVAKLGLVREDIAPEALVYILGLGSAERLSGWFRSNTRTAYAPTGNRKRHALCQRMNHRANCSAT